MDKRVACLIKEAKQMALIENRFFKTHIGTNRNKPIANIHAGDQSNLTIKKMNVELAAVLNHTRYFIAL